MDARSVDLQTEIDRIASQLGVRSMTVGLLTNDGLNIYMGDDGLYHFAFYERGQLGFDKAGSLDDVLYWYCEDKVSDDAAKWSDRKQRFQYEYDVLARFDAEWAKRRVRELAANFRRRRPDEARPEGISLLPDIGEPL
ncbi:hypothetical protein H7J51_05290 [Mycobacterium crocinum]|uniref:Immunity 63 family protein n=2 Tax=Mycobacteriaceae TaxID=1762 RepID=A0ABY3TUI8_9MYCO|nr:immunity 63 family protein [Mycolicibacterium crocinum]MCV7214698.1 hypothetical protein [Mycolicibacterium crocinum]ULN44621.1 immunity 63 family protein [Mycolicibacterium crocinum]